MADEGKKPAGKPAAGGKSAPAAPAGPVTHDKFYQYVGEIIILLMVLYAIGRNSSRIQEVLANRGYGTGSAALDAFLNSLYYGFLAFALYFTIFANILSTFLLMGIIYAAIRLNEIGKAESEKYDGPHSALASHEKEEHKQWEGIVEHINTDNPSDWRLAILEADIILDELLTKIGCVGSTVGDKLKQVEKSDFTTIDNAWEAHKARNAIAHEGQEFLLSKREAQRVIRLYESVFKEFHYI